ncbi:MAG: colanic acid biosynthesis glycosyltransferase WcaL, partial [bacterium]
MTPSLQTSSVTVTAPSNGRATKVAYIMSRFPKITETFILYEMLEQERLGMLIEIYPLLREHQPVIHPEVEALVKRAHFHPFCSMPILRANWHFIRHRPAAYFKMLVEVLRGTFGSANFFFGALGILPKAVRFAYEMQQQGIAHVHAHFATHPAVAALIVHRLTGIPFSFTAHGSDLHVERRMLDKKVAAAAFAVTVSSYNKEVMVDECGG